MRHEIFGHYGLNIILSERQVRLIELDNILIGKIFKARGKDAYANISANLLRILDSRVARYLGEDSWRPGQRRAHEHDERSQRLGDGIRTYACGSGAIARKKARDSQQSLT
jgi:hypothetical protein